LLAVPNETVEQWQSLEFEKLSIFIFWKTVTRHGRLIFWRTCPKSYSFSWRRRTADSLMRMWPLGSLNQSGGLKMLSP